MLHADVIHLFNKVCHVSQRYPDRGQMTCQQQNFKCKSDPMLRWSGHGEPYCFNEVNDAHQRHPVLPDMGWDLHSRFCC